MISTSFIQVELRTDGILVLTINRLAYYNALNIATMEQLEQLLTQARHHSQVRAILVTGAGDKAFVAGADINEFKMLAPADSRAFAERGQRVLQLLESMSIPVVAAVNGFALGGGCELALACHIRIASEKAQLGLPEVKLGIIPGYGGTQRLTQLIGRGRALELMLTGNPIKADEALRIGLVNRVVPVEQLLPCCIELLSTMLERAPLALAKVLEATANHVGTPEGYQSEAKAFEDCCHSEDFLEGVEAFVEKRKPIFRQK